MHHSYYASCEAILTSQADSALLKALCTHCDSTSRALLVCVHSFGPWNVVISSLIVTVACLHAISLKPICTYVRLVHVWLRLSTMPLFIITTVDAFTKCCW